MTPPVTMLSQYIDDPSRHSLSTQRGKIEIFSEKVANFNIPDCPGHAVWQTPFEWLGSDAATNHPLHLLTDQPSRRQHSQLDASPYSRSGKIEGREPVFISTADAAARGVSNGQVVVLSNERGRCLAGAVVTDDIMPGVVRLSTGAWYDPDHDGLDEHGNPNVLTLDKGASGLSQGCSAQTCLVEITPWRGELPNITAFNFPEFVQLHIEARERDPERLASTGATSP